MYGDGMAMYGDGMAMYCNMDPCTMTWGPGGDSITCQCTMSEATVHGHCYANSNHFLGSNEAR